MLIPRARKAVIRSMDRFATHGAGWLERLAKPAWAASQAPEPVGAVYVASNSWVGNEIITFPQLADDTLLPPLPGVGDRGLGSGRGAIPE